LRFRGKNYISLGGKLPGYTHQLYFIVVKGFGVKPMMLLTSSPVDIRKKETLWRIVEYYLSRWKYDESYRHIKQCYNLEDIRVRRYISIRNIVLLVLAVSYFAAAYIGQSIKLKILLERIFLVLKMFFRVPSFSITPLQTASSTCFILTIALQGIKPNTIDDF
jgi:hypothetical protein